MWNTVLIMDCKLYTRFSRCLTLKTWYHSIYIEIREKQRTKGWTVSLNKSTSFLPQILTSVLLVRYLRNIFILRTTVMMTRYAPTPMDHSIAPVLQDTLEMESLVLVITACLILRVTRPLTLPIIPDLFRMKHHHESNKTGRSLKKELAH